MKTFITIMAVLTISSMSGQSYMVNGEDYNIPCTTLYRVIAKSGINVRNSPESTAELVFKVPRNQLVTVCSAYASEVEEIEGVKSRWMEIRYRGKKGFAFGGFLSEEETYDLILTEGIFYERSEYWISEYNALTIDSNGVGMKLVDIKDYLADQVVDIEKLKNENISFLFSGPHPYGGVSGIVDGASLLPGQSMEVAQNSTLYATGEIDYQSDMIKVKNYTLRHRYSVSGDVFDKLLYELPETVEVPSITEMPEFKIHFAGDLDADRDLDIVLWVKVMDTDLTLLLLSGNAEPGFALRQCVYEKHMWD
jgi:hypothetical protein